MTTPPFRRVLVANRGEIAVRIIRACHELGMVAVAVYSDADADAQHVAMADAAVRLGPPPPAESYLRIDAIVEAARATGADAIHPGYGFLAERAAFARAVEDAGLTFVGPSSDAIDALGDKLHARRLARSIGVDPVPGTLDPAPVDRPDAVARIVEEAEAIGFPILVKAAAGGGGRGMRLVMSARDLPAALAAASAEALSAFGDGSVYLEREIRPARHIEVQLLGDSTGRVIALGERDCSLQRRHQKLVEEAPAPGLTTDERRDLHAQAVRIASAAGLRNAATCEFLRSPDGAFHFLEVNTRLQVEHGITELVTGLDIVHEQFRLAAGEPLSAAALAAADLAATPNGHAIEVRLTAEDPSRDFAPTPGTVRRWRMPAGPGVRVDTGLIEGDRIPPEYDNLIAKVMVHAADRDAALERLARALAEVEVAGVQTTLPFHAWVAREPSFAAADISIDWVGERWDGPAERAKAVQRAVRAAGDAALEGRPGGRPSVATPDPQGRLRLARGRPRRGRRPVATVKRVLVRDRLTGEVAGEIEAPADAHQAQTLARGTLVIPDGPGRCEVVVDGWRFGFEVEDADRAALRARATAAQGTQAQRGPTEVRAIIPGRVLTVAVTPGDVVSAGQQLLTVEAMKMQNELRSPRDGTVERVAVGPGQTVEPGDVLVVLG